MFRYRNNQRRGSNRPASIENDVIYLRIREGGLYGQFRRWWHDLFLLDYEDIRSKQYYMSSYAMLMARAAQFQHEHTSIHPFSKFRNFWDCLILHLLLTRIIAFHISTDIIHTPHIISHYFLVVIDLVFILDLYINAKTGYVVKRTRKVILHSHDILMHYLSTKAFIHAMTAIPLQCLMFLRLGKQITQPTAKANLFICTLRIISMVHITRLFQASKYWAKDRGTFARTVTFKFIRIIVVGIVVTYKIVSFSNVYAVIMGILTGTLNVNTISGKIIDAKYRSGWMEDDFTFYFVRFSRVIKHFFLFGFGIIPVEETSDRIITLISYWVACTFHLWAGIVLYNCVTRENSLNDRIHVARSQTFNVLRIRRLSDALHDKVVKYYDYKMSNLNILEKKNCLYKSLPPELVTEIKMSCYSKYVAKIPPFSGWPTEVITRIVNLLQPEIFLSNDLVCSTQSLHDGLSIIEVGVLAVYSKQQETGHLMDGDYFGETALVSDRMPTNTVISITPSTAL
ncbi:potassium/sodium hyperpolarization-activated cyclic nucleotide-gated channel 4-like isoform X2 [Leguminivora glycinivorella]|uniref:potassium/sodium hyperpolarization-activated cyclic nucleotide-gated channel 4-like isoform X2 n=1 Tax=Leguminivora glycinivorella TaxID=1035111 RepID=UPI00200DA26D|nr:potassium/sodium hyperpolarization-activated cyclic nucleotide-gated channel 4-like isoform X2 [Leguminivora glycinivorella]